MTTNEAIEFTGVTRQTLQKWHLAGKVKALLVLRDGRWRRDWDRESLAAAVAPKDGKDATNG